VRRRRGEPACGFCLGARRTALDEEDLLRDGTERDTCSDDIGAFRQEGALTLTVLSLVQRRRALDERVVETRDGWP